MSKSKSKVFCSVYGCNSTYNTSKSISFHCFPKEENEPKVFIINKNGQQERVGRLLAWTLALKIGKKITPSMRVCSLHFTEGDIMLPGIPAVRKRLKGIAVPSKNLPDLSPSSSDIDAKSAVRIAKTNSMDSPVKEMFIEDVPLKLTDSNPDLDYNLEEPNPSISSNDLEELQPNDFKDVKIEIKTEPGTNVFFSETLHEKTSDIKFENDMETKVEPNDDSLEESNVEDTYDTKQQDIFVSSLPFQPDEAAEEETNVKSNSNVVYHDSFIKGEEIEQNTGTIELSNTSSSNTHIHVSNEKEKPFSCNNCSRTFSKTYYLNFHAKACVGGRVCDGCNKSFPNSRCLYYHKKRFAKESVYTCDICNETLTTFCMLKKHIITHNNEAQLVCNICNKSFSDTTSLRIHLLSHSGVRPHVCDVCKRSFGNLTNLKRHKVLHTEKEPYTCIGCDRMFAQEKYLRSHIGRICKKLFLRMQSSAESGKTPYECENCKMSFGDVECLNMHKFIKRH